MAFLAGQHLITPLNSKQICALELSGLGVSYENTVVLSDFHLRLTQGQIGCLLGPSGCGKTSVLRAIAGFVKPHSGTIELAGQKLVAPGVFVEPENRGVGIVFQDFALFPHLSVEQNVAFGLLGKRDKIRERTREMLAFCSIQAIASRYPHELSGGQQQRVALARALAPAPKLLLLDEPFSSLDPDLRERLAQEVRVLLKASATTALLVTHDQHEAFAMADQIGVMKNGRVEQWDEPYQLYHQPRSEYVADFVGQGALIPGIFVDSTENNSENPVAAQIQVELGNLPILDPDDLRAARTVRDYDGRLRVLLRPDDVEHDDSSPVKAHVVRRAFRGAEFIYTLRLPSGTEILALVPSHHNHEIGEAIGIRFAADHVVVFPSSDAKERRVSR